MEQTTDIDEVAFSKLQIRQSNPKEETLEVTKSLIPPLSMTEASEDATENTVEKGYQKQITGFRGKKNSLSCMTGYM